RRPERCPCGSTAGSWFFLLQRRHHVFEPVEALVPRGGEALQPLEDLPEGAAVDAVVAPLALGPYAYQPRLLEDPQVLRHLRLGHGRALDQLAHGRLSLADGREQLAAHRIGEGLEGVADLGIGHASIIFQSWNMSRGRSRARHEPLRSFGYSGPSSQEDQMELRLVMRRAALMVAMATSAIAAAQPELPPAPGRLVDVGGRDLHLYCVGEGAPTVVLEAGLGDGSTSFLALQTRIAEFTRVCAYDRAGYGWSDGSEDARDLGAVVADLTALLDAAGEPRPYV